MRTARDTASPRCAPLSYDDGKCGGEGEWAYIRGGNVGWNVPEQTMQCCRKHTHETGGDYWVDDDAPTRNAAALSEATRVRIKFKSRRTQMLLVWGGDGGFIGVDM